MEQQEIQGAENATFAQWREKTASFPISPVTLLATDYLNHFNEVVMLVDMIPSVPEMLPDIEAWREKTYAEHFRASNLDYGDLAAAAYSHAPAAFKDAFENVVSQLNQVIQVTIKGLSAAACADDKTQIAAIAREAVPVMMAMIASADGIIAGGRPVLQQDAIDQLLAKGNS